METNFTYNSLTLKQGKKNISIMDQELSSDFIAGIFAGLFALFKGLTLSIDDRNITITILDNVNVFDRNSIRNFILFAGVSANDYFKYDTSRYAWWVKDPRGDYVIFEFSNFDFVDGFIRISDYYDVDFRDNILGKPFDSKRNYYNIEGYDLENFNPIPRVQYPIGPYYIEAFEDDPINIRNYEG